MFPSIQNGSKFKPVGHSVYYKNQRSQLIRINDKKEKNRKYGTFIIVLTLFQSSKAELYPFNVYRCTHIVLKAVIRQSTQEILKTALNIIQKKESS